MTTPSPIIMVFGGRISVKYALKRADVARLDTFRSRPSTVFCLVISTTSGCWNKAKKTPGGYAMVRPVLSVKKEPTLLDDLNQALAGETLAAFRYLYLSKIATGISSLPLSKLFREMADGEWDHASRFKESLKLERSSLEFYQRLASKTRDTDMVTHKMAMDAMADEAREERKLTALLD